MRRFPLAVPLVMLFLVCAAACGRGEAPTPNGTTTVSASGTPTPPPVLPAGIPASYGADVPAEDLPVDELVPPGAEVADRLLTPTAAGDAVVIIYAKPSEDPFVQGRGLVVWRRDEGTLPPWRPVFGLFHPEREGLFAIQGITGDATSDGSPDALLFEVIGGVGTCGRWRVIDLAAGVQRWSRSTCDAQIDIGVDPPGLVLRETVFEPGDPHCCPSAIRTSILEYRAPDRFVTTSEETMAL